MKLLLPLQLKQILSIQPALERLKTEKLIAYWSIFKTTKSLSNSEIFLSSKCTNILLKLLHVLLLLNKLWVKKTLPAYTKEQILVLGFRQSKLQNSHYGLEDIFLWKARFLG